MKYEIIKGSEKDFEGCHDDVIAIYVTEPSGRFSATKNSTIINSWNLIAERRPVTEPVWDGSGVPCVGQKVMTISGEGIIDYVGSGVIVYSNNDGQWSVRCDSLDYSLSAIPSHEDVAREKITLNMLEYMYSSDETDYAQVCKIYDAIASGKILGITLSGK